MLNLLYASECWTTSVDMKNKLELTEMWFYWQMLRIPYTAHVTNVGVLRKMGIERNYHQQLEYGSWNFLSI